MPKNVFFLCFFQKIFKKICVCQKKVVPLHSLLKKQDFFCQLKFVIESVAQQVEHIPFKDGVLGSNPSWFTRREFRLSFLFVLFEGLKLFETSSLFDVVNYSKPSNFQTFYITILTILPGTTMIFLGVFPARYLDVSSWARTSFSTSSFGVSFGHSKVKRTLPLN